MARGNSGIFGISGLRSRPEQQREVHHQVNVDAAPLVRAAIDVALLIPPGEQVFTPWIVALCKGLSGNKGILKQAFIPCGIGT
jgi:hypothetical protein